jgi:protein tyrosine phosphatase (PTP) superfamily phosphohydrolase (DUF442 family)
MSAHRCILNRSRIVLAACGLSLILGFTWPHRSAAEGPEKGPIAPLQSRSIENLYRLSPRLYSGAQPEGEAGFAELKRLGIKTVISVDGATPDVEAARRQGLRYVHLPIGYDGISAAQGLRMIKAVHDLPGPVFVHCHHGKHRGPAAAALCAVAGEGWSREQATSWMRDAGTSPDYRGLYRSVESLRLPTSRELDDAPADFPETAPVSTLVETMVQVDKQWDRLKECREAGFVPIPNDDGISAAQAALQLTEQFREMARSPAAIAKGPDYVAAAKDAERAAANLESALKKLTAAGEKPTREPAVVAYRTVAQSCTTCHKKFRDEPLARRVSEKPWRGRAATKRRRSRDRKATKDEPTTCRKKAQEAQRLSSLLSFFAASVQPKKA